MNREGLRSKSEDRMAEKQAETPKSMPRDGLRAGCPKFRSRSSYRGGHFLDCGGHRLKANTRSSRDTFYAVYCCEKWKKCPFRDR